ncbi:hypothetical protein KP509_16G034800 [Ceratopteris richardii]|uniref:Iron permease FTR1 n=1 Tax=Ceratopteris richardii TaxID=49495 RepID=A0A8T2T101_CERRI|nr:hypothetical protein KP509_16G034800 [Ceratopteris richardii]
MVQLFSVPAFFVLFRETLEASIVLSVMLTLLYKIVEDGAIRRRMARQIWLGVVGGLLVSLAGAVIFLSLYYTVAKDAWENSEALWEGILGLIAVVLITIMAFSMIRVDTWRAKWERKLTKVTMEALHKEKELENKRSKLTLFLIPFTVVVREGLESVVFLGGIGLQGSGTAYPIPAIVGILCGIVVGYILYKGGHYAAFKWFLTFATLLLFVIAAGLFAGSVHEFEEHTENEKKIWELECCDQGGNNFWTVFNAIAGWRNEATQGTLSAYIAYWVFVVLALIVLRYKWSREAEGLQANGVELPTKMGEEDTHV